MALKPLALALALMAADAAAQPMTLHGDGPGYAATVAFAAAPAAHPALDAALRAEAEAALSDFKQWGAANDDPARPYTLALTDETPFVSDRYVSVLRTMDFYTGGAHGNRSIEARTWDAQAGDAQAGGFVGIDAFVTPQGLEALSQALRAAIAAQVYRGAVTDFWREAVAAATAPDPSALSNFTLTPDGRGGAAGLTFHYAPYAVASYADGAPAIAIGRAAFADHLTPQGALLFGR